MRFAGAFVLKPRGMDEPLPRRMTERTGKHACIRCLAEIDPETLQRNDFLCDPCAADGDYPLASTPSAPEPGREKR
jgi:hypothetical protein